MNHKTSFILVLLSLSLLAARPLLRQASAASSDDSSEHSPRLLVHLLDYLAVDYGGAVKNGKVLSVSEYKEQLEFIKTAVDLSQSLPETKSSPEIQALMKNLNSLINSKSAPAKVASLSRQIQSEVIDLTHLPVAPTILPNLASGKQLFLMNCAKCHGESGAGNGPSAATLSPKPVNLLGHERMDKMAPFQVFNAIRLGVPNTAMAAFPSYSDQDTWAMAFYAISLRFQTPASVADSGLDFEKAKSDLNLSSDDLLTLLAKTPDVEIEKKLSGPSSEKTAQLAALRIHSFGQSAEASLDFARFNLQESLTDYQAGRLEAASRKALKAYVEGVEPVEPRLKANDPQAVLNLEQLMGLVRSAIGNRKSSAEVQLSVQTSLDSLAQASELLKSQVPSPWLTFTLAFGILLREGFEAVLLIVALLGVIQASGGKKARRWVHGGWIAAVALGIMAWFFSGWLMNVSGLGRELMEGLTGALTVVILLYIGFWLHSRTEINRWKNFIEVQVKSAVEESNLIQL
ncbi:MAG TPA: c-type cytochrome, partial [bacterium]